MPKARLNPVPARPTGRPCKVCTHAERNAIDAGLVAGTPMADLSKQFVVSQAALLRHRTNHIPPEPVAAAMAERLAADTTHAETLADNAVQLRDKALALLAAAERSGDLRTALIGVREAARCLELQGKLTGQIDDSVRLNVLVAPAMAQLQQAVLAALAPFPLARQAVVAALAGIDAGPPMIEHQP